MSAMIYYDELLYLFLIMCWVFVAIVCLMFVGLALSWCIKNIKKIKEKKDELHKP